MMKVREVSVLSEIVGLVGGCGVLVAIIGLSSAFNGPTDEEGGMVPFHIVLTIGCVSLVVLYVLYATLVETVLPDRLSDTGRTIGAGLGISSILAFLWSHILGTSPALPLMSVFFIAGASTVIFRESLRKRIERRAEPGATDNPDDAQRLREDP